MGFQGDVQVNRCIYNRELLIHASPPKGMLSLVVPYSPGRRGLIQGRELEHAELVVVPCGAEGFLRTAKEIAYFVIMIPQVRMLELMKMNDPEAEGLNGSNEKRTGAAREGGAKCLSWKLTFGTADRALFPRQAAHHRVGCVPRLPRSA